MKSLKLLFAAVIFISFASCEDNVLKEIEDTQANTLVDWNSPIGGPVIDGCYQEYKVEIDLEIIYPSIYYNVSNYELNMLSYNGDWASWAIGIEEFSNINYDSETGYDFSFSSTDWTGNKKALRFSVKHSGQFQANQTYPFVPGCPVCLPGFRFAESVNNQTNYEVHGTIAKRMELQVDEVKYDSGGKIVRLLGRVVGSGIELMVNGSTANSAVDINLEISLCADN